MKKLLAIILATLVVLALVAGCSKNEPEASSAVSTPQMTTSTPAAAVTTTSGPSPTPTTTTNASVPQEPATTPSTPAAPGAYNWYEIDKHVEGIITVTGPIIHARDLKEVPSATADYYALAMGLRWEYMGSVCIVLEVDRATLPADLWIGKTITVTGKIERNSIGTLSISVTDLSQIKVENVPSYSGGVNPVYAVYSWEKAIDYIGEIARVTGPIINFRDLKEVFGASADYYALGMGREWGDQGYVGIELKVDQATLPADLWVGKTLIVIGKIERDPSGAPSISVTDLSQIEIIE